MNRPIASFALTSALLTSFANAAPTGVKISEWMYGALTGNSEFIEFTNFGPAPVDFTGWSYDDNTRLTGSFSLSGFGVVAAGQSVILTEALASDFRVAWNLGVNVKILGGSTENLGRADEINLYDSSGALIDRLTYDDQSTGSTKGPRTSGASGHVTSGDTLGANSASAWVLSTAGDIEGSYASIASGGVSAGNLGSPGSTSFASVPEPGSAGLAGLSGVGLLGILRRRRSSGR